MCRAPDVPTPAAECQPPWLGFWHVHQVGGRNRPLPGKMRAGSLRADRRSGNVQARGRNSNAAQVRDRSRPGDVKVSSGRRQFRLDMVFDLPSGLVLVAEYDGAYWHGGRNEEERQHNEERDYYKAREVEAAWRDRGCAVVRIREDPLEPLHHHDIQVPARSDPATCAKSVLFHLDHVLYPHFPGSRDDEERVVSFLRSSASPLVSGDLRCSECRKAASYLLPNEAFLPRPSRSAQRGRAARARSARPASVTLSRTVAAPVTAPALPRPPRPGKPAGQRADAGTRTLSSAANVKPRTAPPPPPDPYSGSAGARRLIDVPCCVDVRGGHRLKAHLVGRRIDRKTLGIATPLAGAGWRHIEALDLQRQAGYP